MHLKMNYQQQFPVQQRWALALSLQNPPFALIASSHTVRAITQNHTIAELRTEGKKNSAHSRYSKERRSGDSPAVRTTLQTWFASLACG